MSFQTLEWARAQRAGSPSAKSVLMALASYAGEFGECRPSVGRLAEDTEQSADSVRRRLAELAALGLIRRFERRRKNGGRTSNEMVLLVDADARAHAAALAVDANYCEMIGPPVVNEDGLRASADQDGAMASPIADGDDRQTPLALCEGDPPRNLQGPPLAELCEAPPRTGARGKRNNQENTFPPTPRGTSGACAVDDAERMIERELDALRRLFGNDPLDRREKARRIWLKLSEAERAAASRSARVFVAACRERGRKLCHVSTWLAERGWEDVDCANVERLRADPARSVLIMFGSPNWAAWDAEWRRRGHVSAMPAFNTVNPKTGHAVVGCWRASEWPPPSAERSAAAGDRKDGEKGSTRSGS